MKLLLITSIREFSKEIKSILKKAEVTHYSYKKVIGFRDASELSIQENWFASEMNESKSILFYAFVKKENVDIVFEKVEAFNKKQESDSTIHIAILNIEKTN